MRSVPPVPWVKQGKINRNRGALIMTDQEIIDLFDTTNITLQQLARIAGRTVPQLKKILMS